MSSHTFKHTPNTPPAAGLGFKASPIGGGLDRSPCLSHPAYDGDPCPREKEDKSHYTCENCAILKRGRADCFDPLNYNPPADIEIKKDGRLNPSPGKHTCKMKDCDAPTRGDYCSNHSGLAAARKTQWKKMYGERSIDPEWLNRPKEANDGTRKRRGGRKPNKTPLCEKPSVVSILESEIVYHKQRIKAIRSAIAELKK